ncbi:MAG: aminotransferase class I/II-fold pyridoxal phosphate-dependent enzyme [Candidatus Competibacterales bacterium]|nr:aminotransferase class I/II-fold pyridoxal phosphate-dependent enzyme [Candidatus Competibacterales bacterium]
MDYDFDTPVERRGSDSSKWGRYAGRDVIPMWVADMDFRSPPAVIEALRARAEHGVFGYVQPPPGLTEAVLERLAAWHGWRAEPDWLVWLPGLVSALNVCCRLLQPEQTALTLTPVYYPFLQAPQNMERTLIRVPLAEDQSRWQIDFDRLEAAVTSRTRLFLLCNPHNPVGRVYQRNELEALVAFCDRHDLLLCSDEIHAELVLDPHCRHRPVAALDPETAARSITLMAPSKTFNLPGLYCGFALIP